MNVRDIIQPKTWAFNPNATLSFSPYEQHYNYPQNQIIHYPQNIRPENSIPQVYEQKYPDMERKYPQYKYPYEIELDEKANMMNQFNKQKVKDEQQQAKQIESFNLYTPSHRVMYMSEKLKRSIDPLLGILVDMVNLEIDCENLKCDLCHQNEFTVSRLYEKINSAQSGIDVEEFRRMMAFYKIQADLQDIELVMTKHQHMDFKLSKTDILLMYPDFYNLFVPLSREEIFSEKMSRKKDIMGDKKFAKEGEFSVATHYYLDHLLRLMLKQESMYEQMRRQIQALDLDVEGFFSYINHGSSEQVISVPKLNQFFRDHGVLFQDCEVQLLAFRMTKKLKEDQIKIEDFLKEMKPKLTLHADTGYAKNKFY